MAFADPARNVAHLNLREGMKVADFGAGSGAYALEIARRIGDTGRVYAIDVQKDLLSRLAAAARDAQIKTIDVIPGDLDRLHGSGLADHSVDAVLISNMLFLSESRKIVPEEAYRILKPGGIAAVIDWSDSFGGLGPHPDMLVTKDTGTNIFREAGFTSAGEFDPGDHHWGLLFKR